MKHGLVGGEPRAFVLAYASYYGQSHYALAAVMEKVARLNITNAGNRRRQYTYLSTSAHVSSCGTKGVDHPRPKHTRVSLYVPVWDCMGLYLHIFPFEGLI